MKQFVTCHSLLIHRMDGHGLLVLIISDFFEYSYVLFRSVEPPGPESAGRGTKARLIFIFESRSKSGGFGAPAYIQEEQACEIYPFVDENDKRIYLTSDEMLALAKKSQMRESTFGHHEGPGQPFSDDTIRKSQISNGTFHMKVIPSKVMQLYREITEVVIGEEFNFLQYEVGGHFGEHQDRQHDVAVNSYPGYEISHGCSVCIYPPQQVTGGQVIVGQKGSYMGSMTIEMPKTEWVVLVMSLEITHQSSMVFYGKKLVFKGLGFAVAHSGQLQEFRESRRGVCD
jgi:hypothetical protein